MNIGLPGRIWGEFDSGKPQNRRAEFDTSPIKFRPKSGPETRSPARKNIRKVIPNNKFRIQFWGCILDPPSWELLWPPLRNPVGTRLGLEAAAGSDPSSRLAGYRPKTRDFCVRSGLDPEPPSESPYRQCNRKVVKTW